MIEWNRIEKGDGDPLILLHGAGASVRSWLPVIDILATQRRVIALDFPGFGRTPIVSGAKFTVDWAMRQIAEQLELLGIAQEVDFVGNSMGGWFALEAAKRGMARSVVTISPAGLWANGMPVRTRMQFFAALSGAWLARTPARIIFRSPSVRAATLSTPMYNPRGLTEREAVGLLADLSRSAPMLLRALPVAFRTRFEGGQAITVPITLVFGSHDRMVRPDDSRFLDQLPVDVNVVTLPRCGHIPMWDNPGLVATAILEGTGPKDRIIDPETA